MARLSEFERTLLHIKNKTTTTPSNVATYASKKCCETTNQLSKSSRYDRLHLLDWKYDSMNPLDV